jgi:hypothetical protein
MQFLPGSPGILAVDGTRVTDEGIKKLQQALPKCKIER